MNFSIIIPTYNRANFILRAVHSALNQNFSDFEVIVVDDGGTDATATVLDRITDPRVKYIWKENGERASARNFGVSHSIGKYVTFLDSDDYLKPNHLLEAYKFLAENNQPLVFSLGYDVVTPDGKILYPWKKLPNPVNQKLAEGNFLSCMGVFIQRELFLEYRFNEDRELSGSEDYELWMRIASQHPVYSCPVSTACLVNHDHRSVLNFDVSRLKKRIFLFEKYLREDAQFMQRYGAQANKIFGYHDLYLSLHLAISSKRGEAIKALQKGCKRYPFMIFNYRFWVVVKKMILK